MLLLALRLLISNGFLQKLWILVFTVRQTFWLCYECFVYVSLAFSKCLYGFYSWISCMFCFYRFLLWFIPESLHGLYYTAGKDCIKTIFGLFIILVNGDFLWLSLCSGQTFSLWKPYTTIINWHYCSEWGRFFICVRKKDSRNAAPCLGRYCSGQPRPLHSAQLMRGMKHSNCDDIL